ncbi:MAG: FtsX-like permease family protein [Chloroflexota bacterium]
MSLTWRKIWRDLAHNKARTALAVLAIAAGLFALGMIYGAYAQICELLDQVQQEWVPIHLTIWGYFDDDAWQIARRQPGVAAVQKKSESYARWRPDGGKAWQDGLFDAYQDYENQLMGRVRLVQGEWPDEHSLAVERQTARYYHIQPGMVVQVEAQGRELSLRVSGLVYDPERPAPDFTGANAAFYLAPETAAWLTGYDYERLEIRLADYSRVDANQAGQELQARLEKAGYAIWGFQVWNVEDHWFQDSVDTMLVIMTVLGALALGMSLAIMVNTLNALIAQQVWQIGVMKTLGASSWRVLRTYLLLAWVYAGLALLAAAPAGAYGAYRLNVWVLSHVNVLEVPFQFSPLALGVQLAAGLLTPPLAGLLPVLQAARLSPQQAINTYGLGAGFGKSFFDRLVGQLRGLPRPLALSLRNTFRRKSRLALTLACLALGGVMFMMIMSATASFKGTISSITSYYGDDVRIGFTRPAPVQHLVEVAASVPGVERAEVWGAWSSRLKLANGEDRYIGLRGVPADSQIFKPRLVGGRMLQPSDDHAILLNYRLAQEAGIRVGDEVHFDLLERPTTWRVAGLVLLPDPYDSFVPVEALAKATGLANRGVRLHVITAQHELATQEMMAQRLEQAFKARYIETNWTWTTLQWEAQEWKEYRDTHYLLLVMALIAALVGAIGLMSSMAINVVERRREIGVMRAIGASSLAITGIFVAEGVLVGILSWLLATPLSLPAGRLFSQVIGQELIDLPLDYSFSKEGALLWLASVILISALASLWPALRAAQVSVRQALAYE